MLHMKLPDIPGRELCATKGTLQVVLNSMLHQVLETLLAKDMATGNGMGHLGFRVTVSGITFPANNVDI